jgi:hypothetical protein
VTYRRLRIEFTAPSCALVRGYGSREMISELRNGRPPVWATRDRAWVIQPSTARDLIAVAESRGYDITITGSARPVGHETHVGEPGSARDQHTPAPQEAGLW